MTGQPGPASASLRISGQIPPAPAYLNASAIDWNSVKLTWGASANATGYMVEQTDLATLDTVRLPYPVLGTSFSPGYLAPDHSYRWRIIPVNGLIEGQASPSVTVHTEYEDPAYVAAMSDGFWYSRSGASWARTTVPAIASGDDGVLVARSFIPYAESGPFKGDNRGFSSDPKAPGRKVTVAWRPTTGEVGVSVEHSCLTDDGRDELAGIWLMSYWLIPWCKDAHLLVQQSYAEVTSGHDEHDDHNRFWVAATATGLRFYGSFSNSYSTLAPFDISTPSIDGELTVSRSSVTQRYHMRWTGNGFPALEATFYPRRASRAPYIVGRRTVQPGAANLDEKLRPRGLYDGQSWIDCTQPNVSVNTLSCAATRGTSYSTSW